MLVAAQFNLTKVFSGGVVMAAVFFALPIAVLYAVMEYLYFQERVRRRGPGRVIRPREWVVFAASAIVINGGWFYADMGHPDIIPVMLIALALTRVVYFQLYRDRAMAIRKPEASGHKQH